MKDKQKNFAYLAKKILKGVLIVDANTNSSVMSYQPSTPIELKNLRYKKTMNSIIHKLISWLEKKNIIEPAEYHLYAYAVKSLFITIFPLLLSVIIGLFFSDIKSSLIIIIPYSLLRKFTGGYHTKSFYTCMLLSCGLIILVNLLSIANYYPLFNLFLCLYFLVYYYFTPVESSKRVLDVYEITTFRKISIYIYIIFFVFYTLLLFLKAYHFATCIFWGITLNVVLIIPCILTKHID